MMRATGVILWCLGLAVAIYLMFELSVPYVTLEKNVDFLLIAGKIVSVEARHAAYFRDLISFGSFANNEVIDANGLDVTRKPSEVLPIAATYIKTKINASNLPTY